MTADADLVVVVNSHAGDGRALAWLEPVRRRLVGTGRRVGVIHESSAAATAAAVTEALGGDIGGVIALGGDGLSHLLVQALAGTGVPLGMIPVGTGNDLAAGLGVPEDPMAAAAAIAAGRTRDIDLGQVVDPQRALHRWWASILCAGFDSAVNERANRMRWPTGPRRYGLAIAGELVRLHPRDTVLTIDDERIEAPLTMVEVANTARYGGGLHIAPMAAPDDGSLDVVVIGPVTRRELARMTPKVRLGRHVGHPAVTFYRGSQVTLAMPDTTAYADGERVGSLPVQLRCVPAALRVFTA